MIFTEHYNENNLMEEFYEIPSKYLYMYLEEFENGDFEKPICLCENMRDGVLLIEKDIEDMINGKRMVFRDKDGKWKRWSKNTSKRQEVITLDKGDIVAVDINGKPNPKADRELQDEIKKRKDAEKQDNFPRIPAKNLIDNTDPGRIFRGLHNVRTLPPNSTNLNSEKYKGTSTIEYNFKSFPSTEHKRHFGYVTFDTKTNDIRFLFCSCKDFFFRLMAPYVKAGLTSYNLPTGGTIRKVYYKTPMPHNHQWTKITNPDGRLFVCKHLYACIHYYVLGMAKHDVIKS